MYTQAPTHAENTLSFDVQVESNVCVSHVGEYSTVQLRHNPPSSEVTSTEASTHVFYFIVFLRGCEKCIKAVSTAVAIPQTTVHSVGKVE